MHSTLSTEVLSISMEDVNEDDTFSAEELLAAIHSIGFEPRRAGSHVFLLNVEDEVAA